MSAKSRGPHTHAESIAGFWLTPASRGVWASRRCYHASMQVVMHVGQHEHISGNDSFAINVPRRWRLTLAFGDARLTSQAGSWRLVTASEI